MPAEGAAVRPIPFLTVHMPEPAVVARDYADIFASGIFSNGGPVEQRFAAELARWIGNDVGVSVTANATVSIQLACRALFPRDRRLVLVASFTAPAGPLAVRWAGFEPVLIDIERTSWQPDPDAAEAFLSRDGGDVAGILLTNTFGTANGAIDRWEDLARRHALKLVIDSAPGFASTYPWGEPLGARGDCEIFSFHATKTVAVGEGGAIATRDHTLVEQLDQLKNFGFDDERRSQCAGLNAKLPELASAIGLRQLEVLKDRVAQRQAVLRWYAEGLEPLGCELQSGSECSAPPFLSAALPPGAPRRGVGDALDRAGIGWREYYHPPIHQQPSFAGVQLAGDLAVTDDLASRIISLPLDEELSAADVQRIVGVVGDAIDG